jgi:hypothetical protein
MQPKCPHNRVCEAILTDGSKVQDCMECGQPLVEAYGELMTVEEAVREDEKRNG